MKLKKPFEGTSSKKRRNWRERTPPRIVIHDQYPVQNIRESFHMVHGLPVYIRKRGRLNGSADPRSRRKCGAQLLEKLEKVGRIVCVDVIPRISWFARIFPVDVDSVEVILAIGLCDVTNKSLAADIAC
jgi:hypothetical protein